MYKNIKVLVLVVLTSWVIQPSALSDSLQRVKMISPADEDRVRRNYRDTSRHLLSSYAIFLEGNYQQIRKINNWLDEIYTIESGRRTINKLFDSGNKVIIRHSEWALHASGRTSAPMSSHLTDGLGEDALVLIDTRMPDSGSHQVFNSKRSLIEFNALHNLFHELVHAKHYTNGSWRYFDSEGQAIEEENIFRLQLAKHLGKKTTDLRVGKRGQQIWWPKS